MAHLPLSSCVLILASHLFIFVNASPPPVVDLGYATYQGAVVQDKLTNATHTQFLGMRYAAPPTGSARFRGPIPPSSTHGIQIADTEPPECFQASLGSSPTSPFLPVSNHKPRAADSGPSEDCLFLNVYVPGNLGEKRNLPVVFWIHGGGYALGSASLYDGNDLLRESNEGVIAVVIQYRLGLFGFLSGHKVKESGTLNAGLLDQQFAMKWVQQHISKFGGDANKVTIWGESSGAGSVLQHIVANGGRTRPPLFRAAITSSTYLPSQYRFDDQIPETLFSETLAKTNCSSAIDSLECLRKVDVDTLQNANTEIYTSGFFGTFAFVPVVDGRFITNRPTVLLKNGRLNGKTHLSVTNTFEGTRFVNQTTANTVEVPTYVTQLFPQLTPQQAKMVADQYAPLGTPIFQVNAIMGESIFICPTYMLLRAFDQRGFKGEFAIPPGSHGLDVSFYFNNGVLPSAFPNQQFVTAFAESFQNFVVSLDPNVKSDRADITSLWKQWGGSNEMLFNLTETGTPDIRSIQTSHDLLKRCDFWESMTSATSQ